MEIFLHLIGAILGGVTVFMGNTLYSSGVEGGSIPIEVLGATTMILGVCMVIMSCLMMFLTRNTPSQHEQIMGLLDNIEKSIDKIENRKKEDLKSQFSSDEEYQWILEGRRKRGITREW